jgi:hypothetical protein
MKTIQKIPEVNMKTIKTIAVRNLAVHGATGSAVGCCLLQRVCRLQGVRSTYKMQK